MKLAPRSHAELEAFFREHSGDDSLSLPEIVFHGGLFAKLLLKTIGMGAITFGRHVFVSQRFIERDGEGRVKIPGWLAAHEAAHVLQYQSRGHARFYSDYLRGYFRALRAGRSLNGAARVAAYLAIAEEHEARAAEEAYRARSFEARGDE